MPRNSPSTPPRGPVLDLIREARRRERGDPKTLIADQRVLYRKQDGRCFDCREDLPHSEALIRNGITNALTARCTVVTKTMPWLHGSWDREHIAIICPECRAKRTARFTGGTRRG